MNRTWLTAGAVCLAVALVWVGLLYARPSYRVGSSSPIRLVRDAHEADVYIIRSEPLAAGEVPYKTAPQEYPLLGILYVSIPRLVTDHPQTFANVLAALNALLLMSVVAMSAWLLSTLNTSYHRLWLLLLPATLYFTFNRFDVLMAVLVLASLVLLFREKFWWAVALLVAGFFVKWFSIVLLPVFFLYRANHTLPRKCKRDAVIGTAVVGGSLLAVTIGLYALSGAGSFYPYFLHMQRGIEYGSVISPVFAWLRDHATLTVYHRVQNISAMLLSTLQLALPVFMIVFSRRFVRFIQTREDVLRWSLVTVAVFLLFAKFYSPQFVLWLVPLALLVSKTWKDVVVIVMLDLVHYLSFPLAFDAFGESSGTYAVAAIVRGMLFVVLIYRLVKPLSLHWSSLVQQTP